MSELFASAQALGLTMAWGSKGASIRLKSPDQPEPISVGWVFLEGDQWTWAKHVTLGVDPDTLQNHPSIQSAIVDFCQKLKGVPGGKPAGGKSNAMIFEPTVFVAVRGRFDRPAGRPGVGSHGLNWAADSIVVAASRTRTVVGSPRDALVVASDGSAGSDGRWSVAVGDAGEGDEVALVRVGEGVEVLLGGLDLGVAHAFHDGFQVGTASEQPGGVGVA